MLTIRITFSNVVIFILFLFYQNKLRNFLLADQLSLKTYLSNRKFTVRPGKSFSPHHHITAGVPQYDDLSSGVPTFIKQICI